MKKFLTIILMLGLLFLACCAPKEAVTGKVIIADGEGISLEAEVTVEGAPATAKDAIIGACQDAKMAYTFDAGMFDGFGGKMSTMTDGWLLYVDKEQAQVGAADIEVTDGFIVEFYYQNYEEAFGGF